MAACNDGWSFTSLTALVSSPLLALTTHGYLTCSNGIGSPVEQEYSKVNYSSRSDSVNLF